VVDRAKLDQMLSNLRAYVGVLRQLATVPRQTFLSDHDKIGNAKYHLLIAIECCIDVANHVIASENYRFPKDNADSFTVLIEHGVLPSSDREPLRAMARFRNRLVHVYWDVDDAKVHEYLQSGIDDLARFGTSIARHEWP
jgi:uncharacterized protein YutE (UPF0331/DUF86 family)